MSRPLVLTRVPFQPPVQRNYWVDIPAKRPTDEMPVYFQYDKLSQNTASCIAWLNVWCELLLICNITILRRSIPPAHAFRWHLSNRQTEFRGCRIDRAKKKGGKSPLSDASTTVRSLERVSRSNRVEPATCIVLREVDPRTIRGIERRTAIECVAHVCRQAKVLEALVCGEHVNKVR